MDVSEECLSDGSSVVVRLLQLLTVLVVFNLIVLDNKK